MERRQRSENRVIDKGFGRREVIELKGACNQTSCVGDVIACKPLSSTTHTCICTHDSQPPFADGNCPRKVITSGVDESSGRIPVQPIASHESRISVSHPTNPPQIIPEDKSAAMSTEEHHIDYRIILPSILVGVVGIIVICIVVILVIKKKHIKREESSPISLKHNILIPERYAPNPQYAACSTADVPILQRDSLKFLQEIGEGCFGRVFRGELLCTNGSEVRTVAIKVLKESASREAEEDFVREVEIMSAFKHPNILSLLGVVFKDENVTPMMVFEFMPHGDLAELLRSQKRSIWEKEVPEIHNNDLCSIALQIASGMKYLASQRFVHRDLACRNCLVSEGPIVKIADFGMSRDVYTCDYYKIGGSRLLPVRWMSPESVVYGRFTLESDVWSYGVVLWEIFSFGKQPYYGHSNDEVVKLILDGIMLIPPKDCPAYICELMKNCWKTDPRHRITFSIICDKLEEIFKLKESTFKFETIRQKMKVGSNKSLPRPPPIQSLGNVDLLDGQGYLKPIEISEPVTYLETICD